MKLCVDCKWYRRKWLTDDQCEHPKLCSTELVRGKVISSSMPCYEMRQLYSCGFEGRLFEPKAEKITVADDSCRLKGTE